MMSQTLTAGLVLMGGALGAPARYTIDHAVSVRCRDGRPWGTAVVNVAGSLALGLLLGFLREQPDFGWALALFGVGFCGSFTTFSTFVGQTTQLWRDGAWLAAWLNVVGSVMLGLLAGGLGYALGSAIG